MLTIQTHINNKFAIVPNDQYIYAPCDGTIVVLAQTKHALGIQTKQGEELLIHIGIDTVELNGQYFESYVKQGDKVKKGDRLMKVDFKSIEKANYDITTLIICTNSQNYQSISIDKEKETMIIKK